MEMLYLSLCVFLYFAHLCQTPTPTPQTCAISIISIKVSPSGVAEEQTGWLADIWVFDSLLHDLGRVEQKSSVCKSASGKKWVEIMDVMVVQGARGDDIGKEKTLENKQDN